MSTVKILVDLDAILDTRLAVAESLEPGMALKLMGAEWGLRTDDHSLWELATDYDEATYKKAYGQRDYRVLQKSVTTNILNYINRDLYEHVGTEDVDKGSSKYGITVNIWPYVLSRTEIEELTVILRLKVPMAQVIEFESVALQRASSAWLVNQSFTHYYLYDINLWLKKHHVALISKPEPRLSIIGPTIAEHSLSALTEREQELAKAISPWESMEQSFCLYVMLRYIDVGFFSLSAA